MNPTVMIGLDGATFTILNPLMEGGTMPFLKSFLAGGVRAPLVSTANPLTPPAWTSMITGRSPGHHGVIDFIWAEERATNHYFTLYNFRDIQCETIWSLVSRQGGRVGALNFPMMAPPPEVNGYIVPGFVSWKHLRRNVYPPAFYDRMKSLPDFDAKQLAWNFELEKKAEQGIPEAEFENWVRFHIARERQWFKVILNAMQQEPSDLTAIVFDGPDKLLHMGWRFLAPGVTSSSLSPRDDQIRQLCLQYFRELDGFMAEIVAAAGPEARVFLTSDHGFGPSWMVLRINSWLAQEGYLTWKDYESLEEEERKRVEKLVDRHFVYLDWDRTTAYARTVTSNGIYIRVAREPGQTGVAPEDYDAFRRELAAKLLAIRDPESGEPVVKQVLTREEAYAGRHNQQAPDLTLVMQDHSFVSIMNKTPAVFHRPAVEGTHYPEGIFAAHGPGIRQGETLAPFSILDIAPILVYSLGLPVPADFEGSLPEGIFDPSFTGRHPYRLGESTRPPGTYAAGSGEGDGAKSDNEEIYKQLQMLGYIE